MHFRVEFSLNFGLRLPEPFLLCANITSFLIFRLAHIIADFGIYVLRAEPYFFMRGFSLMIVGILFVVIIARCFLGIGENNRLSVNVCSRGERLALLVITRTVFFFEIFLYVVFVCLRFLAIVFFSFVLT